MYDESPHDHTSLIRQHALDIFDFLRFILRFESGKSYELFRVVQV